ncbi:hypothetical protein O3M35_000732 [Rhynocoris fuscipes]
MAKKTVAEEESKDSLTDNGPTKKSKKSGYRPIKRSEYYFLRSEEMVLCEIYIPSEISYVFIAKMGERGLMEFLDSNEHKLINQRRYYNQVVTCDALENHIIFLSKTLKENKIPVPPHFDNPEVPPEKELSDNVLPHKSEFGLLKKLAAEVQEVSENAEKLAENVKCNKEFKQILIRLLRLFYTATGRRNLVFDIRKEDEEAGPRGSQSVNVYGGIIHRDKMLSMEILLMRCCHGNYILHVDELTEPITDMDDTSRKCIFLIFFQGSRTEQKVIAVAKAYRAQIYKADESKIQCEKLLSECNEYISETERILIAKTNHLRNVLQSVAPNICRWYMQILKMKAIYHTLNLFNIESSEKVMIARCWVPKRNLQEIYYVLGDTMAEHKSTGKPIIRQLEITEDPPTYFLLNKFTQAYQNIIDAYGIAAYQELNPMPYTVITFPFLFAIMFGDCGHGTIMALFAIFMVTCEKSLERKNIDNEMWQIIFSGRYVILLMGLFSMYTGIIYNDLFSLKVTVFPSAWRIHYNRSTVSENAHLQLNPDVDFRGTPYLFGIDPIWKLAGNSIDFLNSFKMKLSVILGISQMYFGIILSLFNHLYFKNYLSVFAEFFPQLIYFTCLFGYLMFLCFFKWATFGPGLGSERSPGCAPSILITFINMILLKDTETPAGCNPEMFPGQKIVERAFLAVGLVCVPWMLLVKPIVLICTKDKKEEKQPNDIELEMNYVNRFQHFLRSHMQLQVETTSEESEEGTMSIVIHQCIHTIEFVLGSVSYTASYLRLWALSLAHSQLSDVLWERVFLTGFFPGINRIAGGLVLYCVFNAWAFLTVAILVLMEGLSAFLHALRLH